MTTTGPLNSPIAKAIDAHVVSLGGEPLRHKMVSGKAQFWTSINGKVYAAANLKHLADQFGLQEQKRMNPVELPSDLINVHRAAAITGYSSSVLFRHGHNGAFKIHRLGARRLRFSKAEVEAWAEQHRKLGGNNLPRRRKKSDANGAAKPAKNNRFIHAGRSGTGFNIDLDTNTRLQKLIQRYKGTPMEITAKEFVSRVVRQALDKLGV